MQDERKLFEIPTAAYRGKPFWAWNGTLEKEELLRQIDVFSQKGFGGFFMHSRTGLETEYLGKEWMDATADCIRYAQNTGMEPWLYDEDRWPSGCAGGMATEEHQYRQSFISAEILDTLQWGENTIAVFACRMD